MRDNRKELADLTPAEVLDREIWRQRQQGKKLKSYLAAFESESNNFTIINC